MHIETRRGLAVSPALGPRPVAFGQELTLKGVGCAVNLPAADGPLRLVIEGDLRAARAARMIESIEVRPLGSR